MNKRFWTNYHLRFGLGMNTEGLLCKKGFLLYMENKTLYNASTRLTIERAGKYITAYPRPD